RVRRGLRGRRRRQRVARRLSLRRAATGRPRRLRGVARRQALRRDSRHARALAGRERRRRGTLPPMTDWSAEGDRCIALLRDLIFAAVADEEAACANGSLFLVEEHPDEVRAEYMLGEVGAFSLYLFGRTFYPIQVAEKGICWVRATYEGNPGHGSTPDPESA